MSGNLSERALIFDCEGSSLIGIINDASPPAKRGVLIVVGGPQYRVGSHRQFTLLARYLSERGLPTFRFDYRGMGDSGGETRTFENVDADIRSAIDQFCVSVPTLKEIVIWGLCDAASAALFYAYRDVRIVGLVLLNPWVRTQEGLARAHFRHYYLQRLFDANLWKKIVRGEFNMREAASALGRSVIDAAARRGALRASAGSCAAELALPERMEGGLREFRGRVLVILSGNDLTSREFESLTRSSPRWRQLFRDPRITCYRLPEANHTFARREWRTQVERWTEEWVKGL